MTTDKQELQRLCDAAKLHDVYCDGYHALPRAVKRHLSLHDMQEIWHYMVKPTLEALLAELAAVTAERDALKAQVPDGMLRVELALSDRSISRLIPVVQIETSNTNEVERYANQCWRELSAAKEEGK